MLVGPHKGCILRASRIYSIEMIRKKKKTKYLLNYSNRTQSCHIPRIKRRKPMRGRYIIESILLKQANKKIKHKKCKGIL